MSLVVRFRAGHQLRGKTIGPPADQLPREETVARLRRPDIARRPGIAGMDERVVSARGLRVLHDFVVVEHEIAGWLCGLAGVAGHTAALEDRPDVAVVLHVQDA